MSCIFLFELFLLVFSIKAVFEKLIMVILHLFLWTEIFNNRGIICSLKVKLNSCIKNLYLVTFYDYL